MTPVKWKVTKETELKIGDRKQLPLGAAITQLHRRSEMFIRGWVGSSVEACHVAPPELAEYLGAY